jgi:alanine racemase
VEAFGPHIPLSEIAQIADTIDYECLVRISPRVRRVYSRTNPGSAIAQP